LLASFENYMTDAWDKTRAINVAAIMSSYSWMTKSRQRRPSIGAYRLP
jgi:hypothetical protein